MIKLRCPGCGEQLDEEVLGCWDCSTGWTWEELVTDAGRVYAWIYETKGKV